MSARKAGAAGGVCSIVAVIAIVLGGGNIRTNQAGLELIGNAEGCRLHPYTCPAGVLTDGVGNTHGVRDGKTLQEIAHDWERNIIEAETCVNRYAKGGSLPDNAFSAATSLTFRVGCGKVRNSTLFTLFRKGPAAYRYACEQFPRWKYGGGKVLPGLVTRSKAERDLCLRGLDEH